MILTGAAIASGLPQIPKEPILRVETGNHTASVNRLLLSANQRNILTVSDDQTLRIWRRSDGNPIKIIRGAAGPVDEGALYAIAESGRFIAVGGRTGWTWGVGKTVVRIIDAKTFQPRGALSGLNAPVVALAFSPDGNYLAVGLQGARQGLRVFSLATGKPVIKDINFPIELVDVKFLADGRLIALGASGVIHQHKIGEKGGGASVNMPRGTRPWRISVAPNGRDIAITHRNASLVTVMLDADPLSTINLTGKLVPKGGLAIAAWSANGRFIHAVSNPVGFTDTRGTTRIDQTIHTWRSDGHFIGSMSLTKAGVQSPIVSLAGTRRSEGGDGIYFGTTNGSWGALRLSSRGFLALEYQVRSETPNFRGAYNQRPMTNRTGSVIVFPVDPTTKTRGVFDVETPEMRITETIPPGVKAGLRTLNGRKLAITPQSSTATLDGQTLSLAPNERALEFIAGTEGEMLFVGTNFYLRAYNKGWETWRVPMPAPVWGIVQSGNGRFIISLLGNGVIQWRDTKTGALIGSLFVSHNGQHWVVWTPDGFFDHSPADRFGVSGASLIGYHINKGYKDEARFVAIDQLYKKFFRPDVVQAALRSGDGDNEIVQAAIRVDASVAEILIGSPPPLVKISEVCGIDEFDQAAGCGAPVDAVGTRTLRAVLPQPVRQTQSVELIIDVEDQGGGIGSIEVRRNNARIATIRTGEIEQKNKLVLRERLPLLRGVNEIEVTIYDRDNTVASQPIAFSVQGEAPIATDRKRIHVLAVGVADYQVDAFDLTKGIASNDAKAIVGLFEETSGKGKLFASANTTLLLDQDATRDNILKALDKLSKEVEPTDTVVIFLSGHGDVIDGNYTFAPYEIGAANPGVLADAFQGKRFGDKAVRDVFRDGGLRQSVLMQALANFSAENVIVILDTCYAGSFQVLNSTQRVASSKSVAERVARDSGRFVLASARGLANDSDGKDYPPDYDGHGLFTSHALDGLRGAADGNRNSEVSLSELGEYVKLNVSKTSAQWDVPQIPVASFLGDPYFPVVRMGDNTRKN